MPKEHDHDCCRLATSQEAGPLCSGHLLKGPLLPTTPRTTGFPPGCEAVAPQSQNVSSEIGQGGKLAITHLPSFQICDLVYLSAFLLTSAMMLTPLSSNNPSSLHAPCAAVPSPPALKGASWVHSHPRQAYQAQHQGDAGWSLCYWGGR